MKPEDLVKSGKKLEEAGQEYAVASEELQNAEEDYKIIRAKVLTLDSIANLPNQALREAESDVILQNDDRFAPKYRKYLETKLRQRKAWILFDVRKELNENARALFNGQVYGEKK